MIGKAAIQDYSIVPEEAKTPVWFNGQLVDWNDATLQAATHVINYGSGVFEGIRFYETEKGRTIFHLDDHMDRMARSIQLFKIKAQRRRSNPSSSTKGGP